MPVTKEFIEQCLKADRKGAICLGQTGSTRALAKRIANRPLLLPVHSVTGPQQLVGWLARNNRGTITYYVMPDYRGEAQRRSNHNLAALLEGLGTTHPGRTHAFVMPWNRASRGLASRTCTKSWLGTYFTFQA